jgi:hypothetical protein
MWLCSWLSARRSHLEKHWSSTTRIPNFPQRLLTQIYPNIQWRTTCGLMASSTATIYRTGHSGPLVTSNKLSSSSRTTSPTGKLTNNFSFLQTTHNPSTLAVVSPFLALVRCTSSYAKQLKVIISHRLAAQLTKCSIADNNFQFQTETITVPYIHRGAVENRTYTIRFRPALDAVRQVLEDPEIFKSLTRYPERRYIRKLGTQQNMRVWSEAWTGDDWWHIQVCLVSFDRGQR